MVPYRFSQRIQAGPGEPPDESLVDVREPGVGEMIAQVIEVRPGPVGSYRLPCCGRVGERLVADRDPQPVQDPAVAGLPVEPGSIALITHRRDLAEQGVKFEQRVTIPADVAYSGVAAIRSGLTCWLRSAPSE